MNHPTHTIGDSTSVSHRFGSETSFVRPEKLLDVVCFNTTGGTLYLQVFEINDGIISFGSAYSAGAPTLGSFTVNGLTAGHTYLVRFGANDSNLVNGAQTIQATVGVATFVAQGGSVTINGTALALVTVYLFDQTVPIASSAPVAGATPKFSFPVQTLLGGTLGRTVDMTGIYCVWSSTEGTLTAAAGNSGPIQIIIKG